MPNHIAFIGVGNMGNPMAKQLVDAGRNVKVFDVSPDVIEIAKQSGLIVISSMEELLQGATTVISMLPEGKHVRSLYLGDNGILKKIPKNCLIIDCSTIDIETSLELGSEAKKNWN
ncbi:NAD(P)-binding domain-containing protein [Candidatus Pelagibacter sp.]|nr:NAD(P)-binding domain-containing protein [Candidatus Pelagibacter sp.]